MNHAPEVGAEKDDRKERPKRTTEKNMTNAEPTTTEHAAVAQQGAHVAPRKAASKKGASQKKGALKAKKMAKKASKPDDAKATKPKAESKGARILEMIGRAKGATLAQIMKATGWQAHSVRGFISIAARKHGLKIESAKSEAGERVYRLIK
jgi:Protein of unknown function (DUF3489)